MAYMAGIVSFVCAADFEILLRLCVKFGALVARSDPLFPQRQGARSAFRAFVLLFTCAGKLLSARM